MLDEKDIEKIQSMIDQAKDDMLKQSAANTRVIIESSVMKKLDLLIEGQQALRETLAPKSRVEELEEEVSFLKSVVHLHSQRLAELESAVTPKPKAGASAPAFLFYLSFFSFAASFTHLSISLDFSFRLKPSAA